MHARRRGFTYDVEKIELDMAGRGWQAKDLAAAADISEMTVSRFLRQEVQTVKTAKKIALALGRTPRYYIAKNLQERLSA
jgi:transcriptional regulator with XRE-family HTH domain